MLKEMYLKAVDFNKSFGFQPSKSIKMYEQRHDLLSEEFKELIESESSEDTLDALCDLMFINLGSYYLLGEEINYDMFKYNQIFDNFNGTYSIDFELKNKRQDLDNITLSILSLVNDFGYKNIFDEAFDIVYKSNMTKACKTIDVLHKTLSQSKYKDIPLSYVERDGVYYVYVSNDYTGNEVAKGKLIKSVDYEEANFKHLLI